MKTQQRASRESAVEGELLRLLVENVTDYAIFMFDAERQVLAWPAGAAAIFGYSESEMVGRSADVIFTAEDCAAGVPAKEVETALAGGQAEDNRWHIAKGGARLWCSGVVTPLLDDAGELRGFAKIVRDRTAAKFNQQARSYLAAIVESSDDAIYSRTIDGIITTWNSAAQRLYGYSADEVLGQPISILIPLDRHDELENVLQRFAASDQVQQYETTRVCKNGSHVDVWITVSPIKDETGRVIGAAIVARDITARLVFEQRLLKNEQRLRMALEAGRMGTWEWDLGSGRIEWSENSEAVHGLPPGSFGGTFEGFIRLIHPEDRQMVERAIKRSLDHQVDYEVEFRTPGADGRLRWTLAKGKATYDDQGRPLRMSGVAMDITARKQAEQTYRFLANASETLASLVDYQTTLQKVAALAVPFVADWCLIDMVEPDSSLRRLASAHQDPAKVVMLQENDRRFPVGEDAPHGPLTVVRSGMSEIISDVDESKIERFASGREHFESLRQLGFRSYMCIPLASHGRVLGTITFLTAESGRRYQADDLTFAEDLAARATIAIENARLYREVREADRRKDEFLAMLAHELRNPLAPLRSGLDLLSLEDVDRETIDWARGMMQQQVEHLVRLVDDLLDVSRIIRGKVELRPEPVELSTVVSRAVETARPLIDSQEHELTISLTPEPVWLNADLVRLAQVVSNLLNNAAKYTEKRGHIWLTAERLTDEVLLRVRDNGIGVAAENLPRIFDLFTQADRSLDRSQGGLGIGLSVVRNLVEMHGGSVTVKSEGLGKGSEFTVRIPVLAQAGPSKAPAWKPTVTKPRRVLVVDDNVGAATVLAKMLTKFWGHQVTAVHSGQTALDAALAERPELILLDIGLPGMNGYEVAERLRAQAEFQGTVLVALTGYGQDEDRRRSQQVGFDVHLVKPASVIALQELFSHAKLK